MALSRHVCLKKGLFLIGFDAVTRHARYILGHKVHLIAVIRNVTFPDFGHKVHLIAVINPFLDLIDVFEEFIVSFWAIKLTL